jgi:hypothetical protein
VGVGDVSNPQVVAQAPRVYAWFFSMVITIFLKFINDSNNNNSSSSSSSSSSNSNF